MRKARKTTTTQPAKPFSYRESIMKPGCARIALYGDCNPFLGGPAEECCIFINVAEALEEVAVLRASRHNSKVIKEWEIQTLRSDGLWQGCVVAGSFQEHAANDTPANVRVGNHQRTSELC